MNDGQVFCLSEIEEEYVLWLNLVFWLNLLLCMPFVGVMVRLMGLGSEDPEFNFSLVVELRPGGVDSACHPSEVRKMSDSLQVSCVGVATHPGLCPIAKEIASAVPTLCTEYGPNGWMDGCSYVSFAFFLINTCF